MLSFGLLCIAVAFWLSLDDIIFLDKSDVRTLLRGNNKLYRRFTPDDLKARGVTSVEEYINLSQSYASSFTPAEKARLRHCAKIADRKLATVRESWFEGRKAMSIGWRLGCMTGERYEKGFPHTIADNIILFRERIRLQSDNDLIRTLMHEKTHVYQKRYPEDYQRYLLERGFLIKKIRTPDDHIRVNPDTDETIYQRGGVVYEMKYQPSLQSISDTKDSPLMNEHPLEEMAYRIEETQPR